MWTCAGVFLLTACASAITRDQFYPHGQGLDQRLPRGSEVPSPEVPLKVPIVFYGETYESIFVNNYGVLSFRSDIPSFLNAEFPLPYPSIAGFYTNVDTSETGGVYYRETDNPHVLLKAEESVQNNFHEYYDFKPKSVFLATWLDVTYGQRSDTKNSFQIALISNGTESFVELLYPGREIQWIQREPLPQSLPEAKAQAGFIAEDGRVFTLRGSGNHQIRNIVAWSNTNEPGKYVYRVGKIPLDGNVAAPDEYDQTEAEVEEESKTCAQSGPSVCHLQARCVDYQAGICCQCIDGFYGNGKSCIKNDVPLRVHGKLNGVVNDVSLNDIDIQAYVVVADGRSYAALSQTPPTLGSSLQLLNVLGGVIGWMFAKPSGIAKNGYQLTGALFNHTADILFPATGDRVTINQEYLGHDVFDQITLESDVRGSVPVVFLGSKLELSEYEEQYTQVESGLIRSESTRTFTDKKTGQQYVQRVSQTFSFSPCRFAPSSEEDTISLTLKVGKIYLGYEPKDSIVRYGMSNKIGPLGQEDPCLKGRSTCGLHSTCIVQGDSFSCICETGFTNIYLDNNAACVDIDECTAGTHNCDINAICYNHEGNFECRCKPGFEGDGVHCIRASLCLNKNCDRNAQCFENVGVEPACICNPGYTGDGQRCWPTTYMSCDNCSPHGSCVYHEASNEYRCQCNRGYAGDGHYCVEDITLKTEAPLPSPNYEYPDASRPFPTRPVPSYPSSPSNPPSQSYTPHPYYPTASYPTRPSNPAGQAYPTSPSYPSPNSPTTSEEEYNATFFLPNCDREGNCECPHGYNSYTDERNNRLCRIVSNQSPSPVTENDKSLTCYSDSECPPHAVCQFSPENPFGIGQCICPEGYEGDKYECLERIGIACNCSPSAQCIETTPGEHMCVCITGYHGDGYVCRPNFSCTNNSDCEYHAECRPYLASNEYVCQCVEGYVKDQNDACIRDGQLCNGGVCAEHASCLYDESVGVDYCHCDPGYEGEGIIQCVPQGTTCDITNDCHPDAVCTLNYENKYHCVCNEGFTGDGYSCTPEQNCKNNPYMCDSHASCLKRSGGYMCECNSGYNGNGSHCVLNPKQAGNFLVATDGASVYKVPFIVSPRDFSTPLNSAGSQIAVSVDADCETGRIYWGDVAGNAIKRAAYDGTGVEIFLTDDIKAPEGISIDWSARNIFWTDAKKLTIEVANLDTKIRKVLFKDGINNPRGIVVHPGKGKIFWSDWNRQGPKIEWANMDGSQRGIFLDKSDVNLPNSLVIDWSRDRLCFTDAGLSKIQCVGIESKEKEVIASNCAYPFGLAIHGEKFYWSDWKTRKIEYVDIITQQKGQVPIATASRRLYGIAVAADQCPASGNVCQYRNGNCLSDTLCLANGRGVRSCVPVENYSNSITDF